MRQRIVIAWLGNNIQQRILIAECCCCLDLFWFSHKYRHRRRPNKAMLLEVDGLTKWKCCKLLSPFPLPPMHDKIPLAICRSLLEVLDKENNPNSSNTASSIPSFFDSPFEGRLWIALRFSKKLLGRPYNCRYTC